MRTLSARFVFCWVWALLLTPHVSAAELESQLAPKPAAAWSALISEGVALRQRGDLRQSIDLLTDAGKLAVSPEIQAVAAGELGIALLQAHRYTAAAPPLKQAYAFFPTGSERARYAVYLGNLALAGKQAAAAKDFYQEALAMAGEDQDITFSAQLNLARLLPEGERLAKLGALAQQLAFAGDRPELARYHLNLGHQARLLGGQGLRLAHRHLELASQLAQSSEKRRLRVEALDAMAQLYEDQERKSEALQLTQQASALARSLQPGSAVDLLIKLEWRQGRLQKAQGQEPAALAAYQRAVEQIEAVRQDMPIETEDGLSTFRQILEPVYLGYVDLLLRQSDRQPEATRAADGRRAIETFELIRQAELQDFLGDRCAIETVHGASAAPLSTATAILYPIILPDRLELLLETPAGIVRRTSPVSSKVLRRAVIAYADALRNGADDYIPLAQQLYRWLLGPFDAVMAEQRIQNLLLVPEGSLRLVPLGALHDGRQFAIEKHAVSMLTGMSMTNSAWPTRRKALALVAGISVPGPVVEKIAQSQISQISQIAGMLEAGSSTARGGLAQTRPTRALRVDPTAQPAAPALPGDANSQRRAIEGLRARLALPGVKDELDALKGILQGTTLLNGSFTVGQFQRETLTGDYRIVHIASHGVFGGSADSSYIMAFDDVLSMNSLESLLKSEKFQNNPIELLGLSACQTAEGNDRAPLGIAGVAIKARARSVLGTLWPVEDNAAKSVMRKFYDGVANGGLSKTEALRQAQLELLRQHSFEHPFFWAPFVLIGNWL